MSDNRNIYLKEGLDKINEGLDCLDKYIDEVNKTRDEEGVNICLKIAEVCSVYKKLCDHIQVVFKKKIEGGSKNEN